MAREVVLRFVGDAGQLNRTFQQVESNAASTMGRLSAATSSAASTMSSKFGNAGATMAAAGATMRRSGARMARNVSLPLAAIGGLGLKTAIDYERNMNVLQSVSGATGDQMAGFGKLAQTLGADLTLPGTSAADAAAAMVELAKAGLSVDDAMGAAKGVLQLSAAGGLDNATAASVAANALNAFGLKGTEAVRVADLLAAAANASSAEVADLADSLTQGGSVFAQAKIPVEDFVTAAGMLANVGITGSDAGTSLKTMLIKLQNPSAEAAGKLEQLGINIYDAQGRMKPFTEIIKQFSSALADGAKVAPGANKELAKMGRAAGAAKSQMGPLNARLQEQATAIQIAEREHAGIVKKYGATSIQAQKSELAIQRLNRTHDETAAKISAAGGMVSDYATAQSRAAGAVTRMNQEQRDAALGTIFGTDAVRAASAVLLAGTPAFDTMKAAVTQQGAAAKLAGARNKGLGGALDGLKSAMETLALKVLVPALPVLTRFVTALANFLPKIASLPKPVLIAAAAFAGILVAIGPLSFVFGAIASAVGLLLSPLGVVAAGIAVIGVAIAAALNPDKAGTMIDAFKAKWAEIGPGIMAHLATFASTVWGWIQTNGPVILAQLGSWATAFVGWVVPMIPGLLTELGKILGEIGTWLLDVAAPELGQKLRDDWIPAFIGWVVEAGPPLLAELGKLLEKLLNWIATEAVPKIAAAIAGLAADIANGMAKAVGDLLPGGDNKITVNGKTYGDPGGNAKKGLGAFGDKAITVDGKTYTASQPAAAMGLAKGGLLLGVNRPTPLLVGEGRGREDVLAVPHSKGGIGGMGMSQTNNFYGVPLEEAMVRSNRDLGWRLAIAGRR